MTPLGPSPFAQFHLPAAFESEWMPVLSCNCLLSGFHPPLRFYMVTSKGEMRRKRDNASQYGVTKAFWALIGHRVIAGISSSGARVGAAGSPATSALLRLLPSSNWLAICYRRCTAELGLRARGCCRARLCRIYNFSAVLLLFPGRGRIAALVRGEFGAVAGCAW